MGKINEALLTLRGNADAMPDLVPHLAAADPVVSSDALTWTVKIRGGVTFSDGSPLAAGDVVATFDVEPGLIGNNWYGFRDANRQPGVLKPTAGWAPRTASSWSPWAMRSWASSVGLRPGSWPVVTGRSGRSSEHCSRSAFGRTARQTKKLPDRMESAHTSGFTALRCFVNGLRLDFPAVTAGLTLPYSNGPMEGANTRGQLIKQQMYGRARFPLLRQRILLN